jgi:uncharacterized MnhB-related membrane protein
MSSAIICCIGIVEKFVIIPIFVLCALQLYTTRQLLKTLIQG